MYENYVNVYQNVAMYDEKIAADNIVQLAKNNHAEHGLSEDKENNKRRKQLLYSSSKAMVHMHKLRRFFLQSL